jgi:predicted DNA-binding protein with PD1-like motif
MTMNLMLTAGRRIMGRLTKGDDLLAALAKCCQDWHIHLGEVRAIGAVSRARVGYYDQGARQYLWLELPKPLEILSLVGNISLKDGKPFIHAHVTLSDEQGQAFGGHLAEGTTVFAGEFVIHEFQAEQRLERHYDAETGLFLWSPHQG